MADGILNGIQDAASETVKATGTAVKDAVTGFGKGAVTQIAGNDSPEAEAKKKADQAATFQRIKELEAEMRQIAVQNAQKKGPEIPQERTSQTELSQTNRSTPQVDEASRQAMGRAEQGRNFKG